MHFDSSSDLRFEDDIQRREARQLQADAEGDAVRITAREQAHPILGAWAVASW